LILQESFDQSTSIDCAARKTLETGPIYVSSLTPDGTASVVGVVDDGTSSIRQDGHSVAIHNNLFVLDGIRGDSVSLTLSSAQGARPFTINHLEPPLSGASMTPAK
jgi:hypothetical protein